MVVDRLKVSPEVRDRLADSVGTAFAEGEGEAVIVSAGGTGKGCLFERLWNSRSISAAPGIRKREFPEPTPQLFSFNNPFGSCPECTGFGATLEYDEDLILPNPQRSIQDGAVDPWTKPRYFQEQGRLREFAQDQGLSVYAPWEELPEEFKTAVLHGGEGFKGIIPFLRSKEKKAVQAVHPGFPASVPERQALRSLRWLQDSPGSPSGKGGGPHHRRGFRPSAG